MVSSSANSPPPAGTPPLSGDQPPTGGTSAAGGPGGAGSAGGGGGGAGSGGSNGGGGVNGGAGPGRSLAPLSPSQQQHGVPASSSGAAGDASVLHGGRGGTVVSSSAFGTSGRDYTFSHLHAQSGQVSSPFTFFSRVVPCITEFQPCLFPVVPSLYRVIPSFTEFDLV